METICATGVRVSEVRFITVEALRELRADITLKGKVRSILLPRGHQVDAGGVDGAVSQQIRQLRDVPAGPVEHGGTPFSSLAVGHIYFEDKILILSTERGAASWDWCGPFMTKY